MNKVTTSKHGPWQTLSSSKSFCDCTICLHVWIQCGTTSLAQTTPTGIFYAGRLPKLITSGGPTTDLNGWVSRPCKPIATSMMMLPMTRMDMDTRLSNSLHYSQCHSWECTDMHLCKQMKLGSCCYTICWKRKLFQYMEEFIPVFDSLQNGQ